MPDAFGFETPEEAQARILGRFAQNSADIRALGQSARPGQVLGGALSNIFGPSLQRFLDTRAARKDYVQQLMAQGLSKDAAKAQARAEIEPGYREVRQAEQLQEVTGAAFDMMAQLAPEVGLEKAQAISMLNVAARLRQLGMGQEAFALSQQAGTILSTAEKSAAELESLKARTASSQESAETSRARRGQLGKTPFLNEVEERERLLAVAEGAATPSEREAAQRQLGALEAKIAKDVYIAPVVGRTEFDVMGDKTHIRNQMTEIADDAEMFQRIQMARDHLTGISTFDASRVANLGVRSIAFMENWLGKKPTEAQQEFLTRVTQAKGASAFVAALIRLSFAGSALTPLEKASLEPFLPESGESKSVQLAKLAGVENFFKLDMETRAALISGGKDVLRHFFKTQADQASAVVPEKSADDALINDILSRKP